MIPDRPTIVHQAGLALANNLATVDHRSDNNNCS
jgi:hypothetical protein